MGCRARALDGRKLWIPALGLKGNESMKKLFTCLCLGLFVIGLTLCGVGCAENKECPKDCCQKDKCPAPCAHKEAAKPCPKAAAAKEAPAAQPAPAKPAPQGEKK